MSVQAKKGWERLETEYAPIFKEWLETGIFSEKEIRSGTGSILKQVRYYEQRLVVQGCVVTDYIDYIHYLIEVENRKSVNVEKLNNELTENELPHLRLDYPFGIVNIIHNIFRAAIAKYPFDFSLRKTHLNFAFHSGSSNKAHHIIADAMRKLPSHEWYLISAERFLQEGLLDYARKMYLAGTEQYEGCPELWASWIRMEVHQLVQMADARLRTIEEDAGDSAAPSTNGITMIITKALEKCREEALKRAHPTASSDDSSSSTDSSDESSDESSSNEASDIVLDDQVSVKVPANSILPILVAMIYSKIVIKTREQQAEKLLKGSVESTATLGYISGIDSFTDFVNNNIDEASIHDTPILLIHRIVELIERSDSEDNYIGAILAQLSKVILSAEDDDVEEARANIDAFALIIEWLNSNLYDKLWKTLSPEIFDKVAATRSVQFSKGHDDDDESSDLELDFTEDAPATPVPTVVPQDKLQARDTLEPSEFEKTLFEAGLGSSGAFALRNPYGRVLHEMLLPYCTGSVASKADNTQSNVLNKRVARENPRLFPEVRLFMFVQCGLLTPHVVRPNGGIVSRTEYPLSIYNLAPGTTTSIIEQAMTRRFKLLPKITEAHDSILKVIMPILDAFLSKATDIAPIARTQSIKFHRLWRSYLHILMPAFMYLNFTDAGDQQQQVLVKSASTKINELLAKYKYHC